jgi:hypothetical protein
MNVQRALAQLNKNKMNENPELTFTLNLNEANMVLAALQELPAKVANPLSQKITEQAKEQIAKMQAQNPAEVTDVE